MKKSLVSIIGLALILMLIGTIVLCALWLPNLVEYIGRLFEKAEQYESLRIPVYVICIIVALPILVVFALAFKFLPELKNDTIFHKKNALLIKIISIIIFCDCVLFLACVICLLALGEYVLSPALLFVDAIGFIVALMLFVLSKYVDNASILKEEVDATL